MKYRVIVLVHSDLIPPQKVDMNDPKTEYAPWITEHNVISTLEKQGHQVKVLGIYDDLKPIREAVEEFKPHVCFNLLEEFDGQVLFDQNVVSYLQLLKVPCTGSNPRGLMIARDKAIAKKLLTYARIPTPKFQVFGKSKTKKLNKKLKFPIIVKCLYEEASLGLSNASVVNSEEKLYERVGYLIDKYKTEVIVEEFIEGREFYIGVMGNKRLEVLPVWELRFENVENPEKEFYSENAKWNKKYRERKGINSTKADIDDDLKKKIEKLCKRTYKTLELSGYARIDIRVDKEGTPFVLEANPNPNIAAKDEFALSAQAAKIKYSKLLEKLIKLAL